MQQETDETKTPVVPPPPLPPRKKGGRKVLIIVLLVILGLLVVAGIIGGLYAWRFTSAVRNIDIDEVDISSLPDGTYAGSYSTFHVTVDVEVTVEDDEIVGIAMAESERYGDTLDKLSEKVIEEQSVTVDLVSGASACQKVTLKAIENALTGND
ncbi:MAG: FMN-binding protein [Actinomycetota bacterium]|nr:FMN-binding protein [Actinomycetota bacterium]